MKEMNENAKGKGTTPTGQLSWLDYDGFVKRFTGEQAEVDSPATALNKLRQLKVNRELPISEYISKFKNLIKKAKIEGGRAQIAMFLEGLPNFVVDAGLGKGLDTMDDWYKEALRNEIVYE